MGSNLIIENDNFRLQLITEEAQFFQLPLAKKSPGVDFFDRTGDFCNCLQTEGFAKPLEFA